jgi:chromosome segregation ATPase
MSDLQKTERNAAFDGDTCGRMCEGTAYRIKARNLQAENDRLRADLLIAQENVKKFAQLLTDTQNLADKWNFECDEHREDNKRLAGELATEVARNRPLRALISSLEKTKSCLLQERETWAEGLRTLESERAANAMLTEAIAALEGGA